MGRRYIGQGTDTNTNATTLVEARSATTIRPRIYDLIVSSVATPADNAGEYVLRRTTTVGSGGSAYTPHALDPGDPAALAAFRVADTVEPAYTANADLLTFAVNQRATFRWVAAPMGEIVLPAAANGAGFLVTGIGGSAVATRVMMYWEE